MNNEELKADICYFCHAEEGKPRPIGNYTVELKRLYREDDFVLACQGCFRKTQRMSDIKKQKDSKGERSFKTSLKKMLKKLGIL